MTDSRPEPAAALPDASQRARLRRTRLLRDILARIGVSLAGFAVIGSLALIIIYMFYLAAPAFQAPAVTVAAQSAAEVGEPARLALLQPRQSSHALSVNAAGDLDLVDPVSAKKLQQIPLLSNAAAVASATVSVTAGSWLAMGFADGHIQVFQVIPTLAVQPDAAPVKALFPSKGYLLDLQGVAIKALAVRVTSDQLFAVAATDDHRLLLAAFDLVKQSDESYTLSAGQIVSLPVLESDALPHKLHLSRDGDYVVVADDQGYLNLVDLRNWQVPQQAARVRATSTSINALQGLPGGVSLITGDTLGQLLQWFVVRTPEGEMMLQPVREFEAMPGSVTAITAESARRGFLVADNKGYLGIYYVSSVAALLQKKIAVNGEISQLSLSADNQRALLATETGELIGLRIRNAHPDVSLSSLWQKTHHEGRAAPDYVWQATSTDDTYDAKMSLVPLTLGTLKAALYAMLFAIPLGVMAAIYTACFMHPRHRERVKPAIEMMEALPAVIIGFLAGIWFAPVIEQHLVLFFTLLVVIPSGFVLFGFAFSQLPAGLHERLSRGREALLLLIPLVLLSLLCVAVAPLIEQVFFAGDMRIWLSAQGMDYQQRNALVIGVAMGFAIIPTVFTLSEEALFSVPRHLSQGSMALGATAWQTLYYVVLPTASAGILSAIMLGLGRAVGETMIILMASSNSPLVNLNLFEGFRGLTSTLAVELPEAASGSSHFRVLFIAALVLLMLTFAVNTIAELIRQRIRKQYKNL
jgi:phosphate transport system permease protein